MTIKKAIKRNRKLLVPATRQETLQETCNRIVRLQYLDILNEIREELGLPPAEIKEIE